jgi:molybdopterin converting factor small subunit
VKVNVKLLGHLPYYLKDRAEELAVELPPGTGLEVLMQELKFLGLPLVDVELILRNGRRLEKGAALLDGDSLEVMPIAAGG